jgi:hypothetical protein
MIGSIAWRKATIASGAALSDAVPMQGRRLIAIFQPANTEGTAFGLEASHDGSTFTDVFNTIQESTGAAPVTAAWEVAKSATAAQYLNLPDAFRVYGPTHIKIESQDGSNAASNQNAETIIWLALEELPDPAS